MLVDAASLPESFLWLIHDFLIYLIFLGLFYNVFFLSFTCVDNVTAKYVLHQPTLWSRSRSITDFRQLIDFNDVDNVHYSSDHLNNFNQK